MTRINVAVLPQELPDRLLLAEHREIKRVPNVVRSGRYSLKGRPAAFTLGEGHVKFFYDKLGYLRRRYLAIYAECVSRGFNVQDYSGCWLGVPEHLMGEYDETGRDREIILDRIRSKGFELKK